MIKQTHFLRLFPAMRVGPWSWSWSARRTSAVAPWYVCGPCCRLHGGGVRLPHGLGLGICSLFPKVEACPVGEVLSVAPVRMDGHRIYPCKRSFCCSFDPERCLHTRPAGGATWREHAVTVVLQASSRPRHLTASRVDPSTSKPTSYPELQGGQWPHPPLPNL